VASDKVIGISLLIISILVILIYGYILFFTTYSLLLLKATAFIAVAIVFAVLAWIGYTLATTPPPKPIEEIERELEEELRKLEDKSQRSSE